MSFDNACQALANQYPAELESLGESLFDFTDIADVVAWLALQGSR
ncbi:DUF4351 domain-containing protein [[Phormidium] sp. ETS-05]|nr:DUF4351 domain-containing protein [[Phormidium] sp. ETS-05]